MIRHGTAFDRMVIGHRVGVRLLFGLVLGCILSPAIATEAKPGLLAGSELPSEQLRPAYWIERLPAPDRVILDPMAIRTLNTERLMRDPSLFPLDRLDETSDSDRVRALIERISQLPSGMLYDMAGQPYSDEVRTDWRTNLALERVRVTLPLRMGLTVRRADLRAFPTRQRVFSKVGDNDIDRFQETALFLGTPVAVVHESRDGAWWFVISERYAAWVEKRHIAVGTAQEVLQYASSPEFLVVTGPAEFTNFTPESPQVSRVRLDMGVRLPLLPNQQQPVNGQHPYTSYIVRLPVRTEAGRLRFALALLPRTADVRPGFLPLTARHLIDQSFKFLGERYGWGHAYEGRDCSGFVSDVYASFGVLMPRNTGDQAISPVGDYQRFDTSDSRATRLQALESVRAGDLIYIPGHVMMVIGRVNGKLWVIHDTQAANVYDASGHLQRMVFNGVVVTPLESMRVSAEADYIDRIVSIRRLPSSPVD